MPIEVILYRLAVAAGLGFALGYERERHGRAAGLKTMPIVTVSSCLLMIISLELARMHVGLDSGSVVRLDPSRVASYAVAGMGFLGAGSIIHGRGSVQGLTTASLLWAANGIGLAVGADMIELAVFSAVIVFAALMLLGPLTKYIARDVYMRLFLYFDSCMDKVDEVETLLTEFHVKIISTGFECRFDSSVSTYEIAIRLKTTRDWSKIIRAVRKIEGLTGFKWTEGYVP